MRLSVLVNVPSFSRLGLAGSITSANRQVCAEKNLLHDEKVELRERGRDVVRIGVDHAHLLAEHVHRLQSAVVDGIDHLVVVQARFGGNATLQAFSNWARISGSSTVWYPGK